MASCVFDTQQSLELILTYCQLDPQEQTSVKSEYHNTTLLHWAICVLFQGDHNDEMPGYFRFLTVMAFHVFLQEKVGIMTKLCFYWYYRLSIYSITRYCTQYNNFEVKTSVRLRTH